MKYLLLFFISLFCLASCMPVAYVAGVPSLPDTEDYFSNETEIVMVLPIWEKESGNAHTRQDNPYVLDPPLFLTVKELPDLKSKIPRKVNAGLASVNGVAGHFLMFEGVVILSKSGKIIRVYPDKDWSMTIREDKLFQNEREDIVIAVRNSSEKMEASSRSIVNLYGRSGEHQILWNNKEKQSIINFINESHYSVKE